MRLIRFINNMTIKRKLFLLVAFPLLALFFFSGSAVWDKYRLATEMTRLQLLSEFSIKVSALVHETQKERGLSAGFLGSKGEKFSEELRDQRSNTDKKVEDLKLFLGGFDSSHFGDKFKERLDGGMKEIKMLNGKRESINALAMAVPDAVKYYTEMNGEFLEVISHISRFATNMEMASQLRTYAVLLTKKELAGQERALLNNTFAANKFGPGMLYRFHALVAAQDVYGSIFLNMATRGQVEFYEKKIKGQSIEEVLNFRRIATEKAAEGNFGVDPAHWFKTKTGEINILKEVEDRLSADLNEKAAQLKGQARSLLTTFIIMGAVPILTSLLLSFLIMRGIIHQIEILLGCSSNLAACDLRKSVDVVWGGEMGILAKGFASMSDNWRKVIGNVSQSSSQIASASEELSASSEQMSKGMQVQAQQTSQIAAAIEEMNATVVEVAKNSQAAASSARDATEMSRKGGAVISETIAGMAKIAEIVRESAGTITNLSRSSDQIGEITTVINDIADQTNLLALNAAIEAARAGEQGRGFAVVADEVRKLAERTTKATKEIASMIKNIQKETSGAASSMKAGTREVSEGVNLANQAGDALTQIVAATQIVNSMVAGIATAAEQQSATTAEISRSIETIRSVTTQSASGTHQTATASHDLSKRASELDSMVRQFKI